MKYLLSILLAVIAFSLSAQTLVVFDGNSLTCGTNSSTGCNTSPTVMTGYDYPAQTSRLLTGSYSFYNFGVNGQGTVAMSSDAASQIDVLYSASNTKNIVIVWEGTNDMTVGGCYNSVQAHDHLKTYCLARKAAGYKVIVLNVIVRYGSLNCLGTSANFDTARANYNALMAAQYTTYADALVDVAGQNATAIPIQISDGGDNIHTNNTGYATIAGLVSTAINSVVAGGGGVIWSTTLVQRGRKAILQ